MECCSTHRDQKASLAPPEPPGQRRPTAE